MFDKKDKETASHSEPEKNTDILASDDFFEDEESNDGKKKKLGLTARILIALALGLIVGVIFHYTVPDGSTIDQTVVEGVFYVIGQGFIRLLQMLVVPLVFCSIVCGAASIGDTKTLGTVGVKTLAFYICTTALAVCVALIVANIINPGLGVDMSAIVVGDTSSLSDSGQSSDVSVIDTLLAIIPANPVEALANGDMLAIIFFALFVGIIIAIMGRKVETVHSFFEQFNDIMMKMTSAIMIVAPIGVFCLLARTFANVGFEAFFPMLKYMGSVLLGLLAHCLVIYMILLFGVELGPMEYLTVIATATLASIGTAGVPSVGLITLSMVFNSVGLPLEGIALIMGIDRILDMARTAVNITGDAVCTTVVARQEKRLDLDIFNNPNAGAEVGIGMK